MMTMKNVMGLVIMICYHHHHNLRLCLWGGLCLFQSNGQPQRHDRHRWTFLILVLLLRVRGLWDNWYIHGYNNLSDQRLAKKMFGDIKKLAVASIEDQKEFVAKLDLQGLTTHWFQQLVVIQNQDDTMTDFRKKLKRKMQQVRRLERQVVSKKEEIQNIVHGSAQSLEIVRSGRRLTWRTSVILGLRKLMCIISANAFPLASLVDVSRWTVTRCEIMAWAVLLGRTRAWYKTLMTLLKDVCQHMVNNAGVTSSFALVSASEVQDLSNKRKGSSTSGVANLPTQDEAIRSDFGLPSASSWISQLTVSLSQTELNWDGVVACTSWAGDATNSSIWQRQKLQGIEIRTIVLTNKRALVEAQYDVAFTSMVCMLLAYTTAVYFINFVIFHNS